VEVDHAPKEKPDGGDYPGNNQLLADYRAAKQLGLLVQTRILPPETRPLSFDALLGVGRREWVWRRGNCR
jgi:hypothetical protein